MTTGYQSIPLTDITPSPVNPRREFAGPKFDELVASIRQKGVIEPIIVRPKKKAKAAFEIVAGERRFRASKEAGLKEIPAIVRELTDDEAYDFMLIENLQRADLTELEEAESFKAYADRHGKDGAAIATFCEKTGIRPAYVRARIAVLALPKDVLAMWKNGELNFGHLHQLLRVSDPKTLKDMVKGNGRFRRVDFLTVSELKDNIDEMQIPLGSAKFSTKTECAGCGDNTSVQADLFGFEPGKASCTKTACFMEKQRAWLTENWEKTGYRREHKTNGFQFNGDVPYSSREDFVNWNTVPKPAAKCLACPSLVTIIEVGGKVDHGQSCVNPACYKSMRSEKSKPGKKAKDGEAAPRADWHGEYFRDRFFRAKIQERVAAMDPANPDGLALIVAAAASVKAKYQGVDGLAEILGPGVADKYDCIDTSKAVPAILGAAGTTLIAAYKAVLLAIVMDGQSVDVGYHSDGFRTVNRAAVARFLGVDLVKEFAVTEEYLQKKTTAEILAFIMKFGLHERFDAFKKALNGKPHDKAKKSDLVKAVLAIGPDLVGAVPDEILKAGKEGGR